MMLCTETGDRDSARQQVHSWTGSRISGSDYSPVIGHQSAWFPPGIPGQRKECQRHFQGDESPGWLDRRKSVFTLQRVSEQIWEGRFCHCFQLYAEQHRAFCPNTERHEVHNISLPVSPGKLWKTKRQSCPPTPVCVCVIPQENLEIALTSFIWFP